MSKPTSFAEMQDLSTALAGLVASTAPSVVSVSSGHSRSSGFIWRTGLVVTADEALSDDGDYSVGLWNGDALAAQLVGRDSTTDVALLRVDRSDLQSISPTAPKAEVGALAIAVGAEDGNPIAALGIVSHSAGPWRSLRGGEIDARIELDLRLRKSAEGGVVLDAVGQSIGMAVFGPRRRVLVIPSSTIERVAAQLEARGYIARGYLGLGLQALAVDGDNGSGRHGYER
jgi:S1-C subfamily serine protease